MTRPRLALTPLTDWLATRPLREQGLILACSALIAVYLAVTLLWQPLLAHRAMAVAQISTYEHALGAVARLPPVTVKAKDARPIARILTETAPDFGLAIRRIDATDIAADLTLEDAAFDSVVLWLDTLEGEHGLSIASLQITRRPQAGLVAATLTLKVVP